MEEGHGTLLLLDVTALLINMSQVFSYFKVMLKEYVVTWVTFIAVLYWGLEEGETRPVTRHRCETRT